MDRTERFYKIREVLRRHKVVSFSALLTELEVSRSTLKRDLNYLSTRLNHPITYSRDLGGYQLEAGDGVQTTTQELPGLWFAPAEVHALLTMQQVLTGLDPAGLLGQHIAPLMDRLNGLLGSDADTEVAQLRHRVRVIALARRKVTPRYFECVATALARRKQLHIGYTARGSGHASERDVSPLRLMHYRENWYLDAWCHWRDELRSFALDAVTQARLLKQSACEVDSATLDATFGPSYGIFSGGRIQWARLQFTAERARWVANEEWHPQQKCSYRRDGSYLLSVPYSDHRELLMDILRHGRHCEVLGPVSLRRAVAAEVQTLHEKYI